MSYDRNYVKLNSFTREGLSFLVDVGYSYDFTHETRATLSFTNNYILLNRSTIYSLGVELGLLW